ncbi:TlpA disulfide reductase family protein [uncultured Chitinophaga sp.]|uniref:TlpA family protein disulfide reductase n=1 Tax=uncultured Chitinophaga sp. TaxID=339340 RepID=UPI0025D7F61D|nr:TlpA disulfide reductase family protein [uncultured Chitinophaga sp.]
MSKNKLRLLSAAFGVFAMLTTHAAVPPTIIQGKVNKEKPGTLYFYTVKEGEMQEYAHTRVGADNGFIMGISAVEEGYYYVSDNKRDYIRLYLKPGEQVKMNLSEDARYELVNPSAENKLLLEWANQSVDLRRKALMIKSDTATYVSFFPKFEQMEKSAAALKAKATTSNKKFNELFKFTVDADLELIALSFLYTPHPKHPSKEQYIKFYSGISQASKYCDGKILKLGEAGKLVGFYTTWSLVNSQRGKMEQAEMLKWSTSLFCNDTLKGMQIVNSLRGYKSYDKLVAAVDPLKKYLTKDQLAAYTEYEKSLRSFKAGEPGLNFSYPDMTGKSVSLKDLKGKVVLVDVWATWCGPCKAEIPSLKALEKEMHDKDVAFVSISVDVEKDKEKWKEFVEKEQLTGIQLFATGWSDITKYYNITGIPRFMVFDQQGNIVTIDAPRPSSPDLKKLLEKTLKN